MFTLTHGAHLSSRRLTCFCTGRNAGKCPHMQINKCSFRTDAPKISHNSSCLHANCTKYKHNSPCNNLVIRCGASPPTMKAHNQISHEISKEEGKHSILDFIQKMPDPLLHQLLILCCTENTTLSICAMFGCFWPAAHGYLSLISQSRICTKYT